MFRVLIMSVTAFVLVVLPGCSNEKRPDGFPKIYSASVTVLDDNGPVSDVKVTLFDKAGASPWPIGGTTDKSGKADLITYGKFKGAPQGDYTVVLSKSEIEDADQMSRGDDDSGAAKKTPKKTSFRVFSLIDPKYSNKDTSSLSMTVQGGGTHETFKLGKPVREQISTIRTDVPEG